jgi:hypothetical protein
VLNDIGEDGKAMLLEPFEALSPPSFHDAWLFESLNLSWQVVSPCLSKVGLMVWEYVGGFSLMRREDAERRDHR